MSPWCRTRIHFHPLACTWAFHLCLLIPQPHLHLRLRCRSTNTAKIHKIKSVANTTSSTSYEPNATDNFDYSETYTAIFQNESVDIDTEPSYSFDMELDDELIRKALSSPLFTQEREEPANLRQTIRSLEESLLPAQSFFAHTITGRAVCEPSSNFVSKTEIKSRPGKQANPDSLWKTPRANSCWSQISDPAARTSSRFWQKKYSGIIWDCWFSATGNWSYYYTVWAIQERSITTSRRKIRTKSGSSWNLYQEYARHGRIAVKSRGKGRGTFKKKIDWRLWGSNLFFQGPKVKTVYILGDNDAKYPYAEIDDEHTRNSQASTLYLQERDASASLMQVCHSQKRKFVSRCTANQFKQVQETRQLEVTKAQI